MISRIASATVFERLMNNGEAFIMGVLELADDSPIEEGRIYPLSLSTQLLSLAGERRPMENGNPNDRSFKSNTIQTNLQRAIWPTDAKAFSKSAGQWFFAVLLPLEVTDKHFFFYAPTTGGVFESLGDSWHKLVRHESDWAVASPLCQSTGHNAMTLSRSTFWPVAGGLYSIDTNPTEMRDTLEWFRDFYLDRYRSKLDIANSIDVTRKTALMQGLDLSLVDSLLPGLHGMYADPDYIVALDLADRHYPIKRIGRAVPAEVKQARAASMQQAIDQIHNRR